MHTAIHSFCFDKAGRRFVDSLIIIFVSFCFGFEFGEAHDRHAVQYTYRTLSHITSILYYSFISLNVTCV